MSFQQKVKELQDAELNLELMKSELLTELEPQVEKLVSAYNKLRLEFGKAFKSYEEIWFTNGFTTISCGYYDTYDEVERFEISIPVHMIDNIEEFVNSKRKKYENEAQWTKEQTEKKLKERRVFLEAELAGVASQLEKIKNAS